MTPDWQELELDDALISVLKAAGLNKPAKVQQAALPAAMDGHDLLISSPTGTGKTLAFLLPVLQHMMDFPRKQPGLRAHLFWRQLVSWRNKSINKQRCFVRSQSFFCRCYWRRQLR